MKVIGLTGGIGSGKSAAARFLKELGAVVTDLDKAGHEVLRKGGAVYQAVVEEFGNGILKPDGEIDRIKLGEIVFDDRKALKRLNAVVHPAIDKVVENKVDEYRRKGVKVIVFEAAAMLEAGKAFQVDEIWAVTTAEKNVLERLQTRPGYNEADVKARIRSQMTDKERVAKADVVIANDGTLDELKEKVGTEWQKLQERLS